MTVVIAATNRPDVLDPALLRGFSGADLANLVNEAALGATRPGVDSVEARDFAAAYDKIVLGELREAKLDVKEKHRVAVHESGHAVVAYFVPEAEPLERVSIIPRGMELGATQQVPAADRHIMTLAELQARLTVLIGGYAAERTILKDISSGAEDDLEEATRLATRMVANFGMSEKLGAVYHEHETEHPFLGARAVDVIEKHRVAMDRLVETTLETEVVEEKPDLVTVLGEPTGTKAGRPSGTNARCIEPGARGAELEHRING